MKVVLISPYMDTQAFGLRTISACLKREGYDVQLIFLTRSFKERYEESILNDVVELSRGSDLVGISLMTNFFDNVVQLTQRLKKDLSIPIIWGGIHPTILPAECLDYADMVCIGEGEETVLELAKRINDKRDYKDIQGMWLKDKDNIIKNKMRQLNQDLDSIPFPDFDYGNHYILDGGSIHGMDEDLLSKRVNGTYVTIATRGCPFSCTYCCNNALNKMYPGQKRVRKRSPGNLVQELMSIKRNLPFIERIMFDDDAFFTYTVAEIREFCEKYKENVGLPLIVQGITPITLTRDKLSLLVDAGLILVRMGIQTASENTKKLYQRHYSNQKVEKAAMIFNEFKDKIEPPQYDIILDNPWETEKDLIATLMFLVKLPTPYELSLFSLTFYQGTELYRRAKRDGIITDDLKDVYRKFCHACKNTYLNKLFYLLNEYAQRGIRISPRTMSLLTNRKLRQSRLSWFIILLFLIIPFRIAPLLYNGMKAMLKGDWSRILKYMEKIVKR